MPCSSLTLTSGSAWAVLLLVFLTLGGLSFAMFGIIVAFWAKTFDHVSAVSSFVIQPLIYLGGVFFSLQGLHPFWQTLSKVNPLLYVINGVRLGMLGQADVSLSVCFAVSFVASYDTVDYFLIGVDSEKQLEDILNLDSYNQKHAAIFNSLSIYSNERWLDPRNWKIY